MAQPQRQHSGLITGLLFALSACGTSAGPAGAALDIPGSLTISHAVAWGLAAERTATIGMVVRAEGGDTLREVIPPSGTAAIHQAGGGPMIPVEFFTIPPGRTVTLGTGGVHIMVSGLDRGYAPGDSLAVTFRFSRAGRLTLTIPVLRFGDAQAILTR